MLLEHLALRRMDGGKKMTEEEEVVVRVSKMTEENSRQTTLEEFGFECHRRCSV